ncbi:MAG: lysine 2,3-aminomutase [bacterium]
MRFYQMGNAYGCSLNAPSDGEKPPHRWRDIPLWANVREEDWNDWKWQVRHRIRDATALRRVIDLTDEEAREVERCIATYPMAITPYYASLMDRGNPNCPIRKQAVPSILELTEGEGDEVDPLEEECDSPVRGLTHRYPDRALFLTTDRCAMYCRHCTRKRVVGRADRDRSARNVERILDYIRNTDALRDIILSGGDPLMLDDDKLEDILRSLREIPHIEIIRIGTRVPVTMPMRITPQLAEMIGRYHPVWLNTHFNHPKEITPESARACDILLRAGIPVGNQSVLLRGVNDCPHIMRSLLQGLLKIRVRPYYLYQCDLSRGVGHFRTPVSRGIQIIESLRGHTSGLAVPTFVIDGPGGSGKIPVMPSYMISQSDRGVVLRNYEGFVCMYKEPGGKYNPCDECGSRELCTDKDKCSQEGVAGILGGERKYIVPTGSRREKRRVVRHIEDERRRRRDAQSGVNLQSERGSHLHARSRKT